MLLIQLIKNYRQYKKYVSLRLLLSHIKLHVDVQTNPRFLGTLHFLRHLRER